MDVTDYRPYKDQKKKYIQNLGDEESKQLSRSIQNMIELSFHETN